MTMASPEMIAKIEAYEAAFAVWSDPKSVLHDVKDSHQICQTYHRAEASLCAALKRDEVVTHKGVGYTWENGYGNSIRTLKVIESPSNTSKAMLAVSSFRLNKLIVLAYEMAGQDPDKVQAIHDILKIEYTLTEET